jgi:hypothetical protein
MVVAGIAYALLGCEPRVESSAVVLSPVSGRHAGPIILRATDVPPGAKQVASVEANGTGATLSKIMNEFTQKVASVGGDFGKIDSIRTKFDMITTTQTYTYTCGSATCTGTNTSTHEVATTTVVGRAFRQGEP